MTKENNPLLSDEFLEELVKEINQQYGFEKDHSLETTSQE